VSNLLNNASKYTPDGGDIGLRVTVEGREAVLSVSDSGVGIAPEALAKVFEMFAQVPGGPARPQGGLGIGLSLVQSLVALHGGTVSATSAGPGRGSTFTVRLPRVDGQWPSIHDSAMGDLAPAQASGLRVLVADDNQDAAMTLASLLEFEGHHVHVAFDGEQAVASAEAQPPDVAFLDLGMPHLDGVEVARRLRALEATKGRSRVDSTPSGGGGVSPPGGSYQPERQMLIVALTGWGQEKDRHRTREAGFDAHLVKPPRLADLVELMRRAQGQH